MSVAVASAALIAIGALSNAQAASASVGLSDDRPSATFHCSVLIEADFMLVRFDMHKTTAVVATSAPEAEAAALSKVRALLPPDAAAAPAAAECTAIA